jgi:voltage-gated potassium channel
MERAEHGDRASRAFDLFIVALIGLNVAMVIVETVQPIANAFGPFLQMFEAFSVIVFTVEYVLRLWSCTSDPDYASPITGRVRFSISGFALIDFLAIAPFYLQLFLSLDPAFVGAVRLLRLFRLFKMGRYIRSIRLLGSVVREKRKEMLLVATVLIIVLIMISSLMFYVEHEAQPEAFSSIPAAMWWGMVTLTTIGYGDVFPITPLGKFFGILVAMLGIGMFALPAGILSSGFVEAIAREGDDSDASTESVAAAFVDAINRRDLEALLSLFTEDHRLIDSNDALTVGPDRIRAYWAERLETGYAIVVTTLTSKETAAVITGSAVDDSSTRTPAAWEARVSAGRISELRCFGHVRA